MPLKIYRGVVAEWATHPGSTIYQWLSEINNLYPIAEHLNDPEHIPLTVEHSHQKHYYLLEKESLLKDIIVAGASNEITQGTVIIGSDFRGALDGRFLPEEYKYYPLLTLSVGVAVRDFYKTGFDFELIAQTDPIKTAVYIVSGAGKAHATRLEPLAVACSERLIATLKKIA